MTKVLNPKHTRMKPPICGTIVWWLFLDRIQAPGWAWGAVAVLASIVWILWGTTLYTQVNATPIWEAPD